MVTASIKEVHYKRNEEIKNKLRELDKLYSDTEHEYRNLWYWLKVWAWRPAKKLNVNGQKLSISDLSGSKINELNLEFNQFKKDYKSKRKELKALYKLVEEETTANVDSDIKPEFEKFVKNIESLIKIINSYATDLVLQEDAS